MSFQDCYPPLLRALSALDTGQPVGSHEILEWLDREDPDVIARLRGSGYLDADDPRRAAGWSWRSYLGNALARMHQQGLVQLVGKTDYVPPGYSAPVGLWRRVPGLDAAQETVTLSLRLSEEEHSLLSEHAAVNGNISLQAVIRRAVQQYLGSLPPGLRLPERTDELWTLLVDAVRLARVDAGMPVPLPDQCRLMWFAYALSLRIAERIDAPGRPWSSCARKAAHATRCGPPQLLDRIVKRWNYEERNDLVLFTQDGDRAWPLIATESEAALWHHVDDAEGNDFLWDFYKLFGNKAFATLFIARAGGMKTDRDVRARIERLKSTLDGAAYQKYRNLLRHGQPVMVVIVPRTGEADVYVAAAVSPGPLVGDWVKV